jgi:hypothetical protein
MARPLGDVYRVGCPAPKGCGAKPMARCTIMKGVNKGKDCPPHDARREQYAMWTRSTTAFEGAVTKAEAREKGSPVAVQGRPSPKHVQKELDAMQYLNSTDGVDWDAELDTPDPWEAQAVARDRENRIQGALMGVQLAKSLGMTEEQILRRLAEMIVDAEAEREVENTPADEAFIKYGGQ